jgi:uncharacterized protein with PIN domain
MRLVCDAMLAGLARWLRAAGHDTLIAASEKSDADLIETSRAEQRVLLSRDRHLIERAQGEITAVLLIGNDLDEHVRQLRAALDLNWNFAPFTRCLIDNSVLRPANESERMSVPERSRHLPGPFTSCPSCGRVFWPGSHVKRMTQRLELWQARLQKLS